MSEERHGLLETIAGAFVPVHRDGHKFVAIAGIVTLIMFVLSTSLGWLCAGLTAYIAYFFRDPDRVTPLREGLIIAPADGRVSKIERALPPRELGLGEDFRTRVSIFLSIFDVHVNRAPITGIITKSVYTPGLFLNADLDKASEDNERRALIIKSHAGDEIAVVQIAGLIARRIVTFSEEGDRIGVGERFGLIRFGSRVDIYLPDGCDPMVSVGQRTIAGETVIADMKSDEGEREARIS